MIYKWFSPNGGIHSNYQTKVLGELELQEAYRLSEVISKIHSLPGEDALMWGEHKSVFNCNKCYRSTISVEGRNGRWKLIWKLRVPPNNLFLWQLSHKVFQHCHFCNLEEYRASVRVNGVVKIKRTWSIFSKNAS